MKVLRIYRRLFAVCLIIPFSVFADQTDEGQVLFDSLCAECHGKTGDGNGPVAETMVLKPRDFALAAFKFDADADWQKGTDADLADVIRQGPGAFGGSTVMPPFAHLLDEEIASLISFIRSREQ